MSAFLAFAPLLAAGGMGTILLVGMIVTIVGGGYLLGYIALTGTSDTWQQICQESEEFSRTTENSGPIRRYPAGGDGYLPAEVSALGDPVFLHRYQSLAEQCHLAWLYGSPGDKYPTYISYATALVVVTPDAFTVIPWEEITEFLHTVGFKASNGQKFVIGPDFTEYGPLFDRLEGEVLASQLPRALAALAHGQDWVFEPFTTATPGSRVLAMFGQSQLSAPLTISKAGLRYQDERLAWCDIGSIQVTRHLRHGTLCKTTLSVRKSYHLLAAMEFDFSSLPNSFLLTELLPHVCPPHLLVPTESS
jgi:hypothetical protein